MLDPIPDAGRNGKIAGLDGLRGFAALLVFASHSSLTGRHLLPFYDTSVVGKMGVFLFFLLSSYLLSLPFFGKGADALQPEALKRYFVRRIARIYPLYLVYLLLALVTTATLWKLMGLAQPDGVPLTLDSRGFFEHVFLQRGDGLTWSIVVEFKFYFLLPLVSLLSAVALRRRPFLSATVLLLFIVATAHLFDPSEMATNDIGIGYYLPVFLMGHLLALFSNTAYRGSIEIGQRFGRIIDIIAIAFAATFLAITPPVSRSLFGWELPQSFFNYQILLQGILCAPILIAVPHGAGWIRAIFECRALRLLGLVSFSLYLWHPVFIQGVGRLSRFGHPTLLAWISLAGSIIGAMFCYRFIEMSFAGAGQKAVGEPVAIPR